MAAACERYCGLMVSAYALFVATAAAAIAAEFLAVRLLGPGVGLPWVLLHPVLYGAVLAAGPGRGLGLRGGLGLVAAAAPLVFLGSSRGDLDPAVVTLVFSALAAASYTAARVAASRLGLGAGGAPLLDVGGCGLLASVVWAPFLLGSVAGVVSELLFPPDGPSRGGVVGLGVLYGLLYVLVLRGVGAAKDARALVVSYVAGLGWLLASAPRPWMGLGFVLLFSAGGGAVVLAAALLLFLGEKLWGDALD